MRTRSLLRQLCDGHYATFSSFYEFLCVICVRFKCIFLPLHFTSATCFALTCAAIGLRTDRRPHLKDILRHLVVSVPNLCTL